MKRRDFLTLSVKSAMAAGMTAAIPLSLLRTHNARAAILATGLSDCVFRMKLDTDST